jgi:NAD(P)H-flavin reductase/hemoglobin-like flavoprotein
VVDARGLKDSFAKVAQHGDEVPLFFYSYLFLRHPQTRPMFPPGMAAQRDRLVGALAQVVTNVDEVETLVPILEHLGHDHRKFQVEAEHYPAVGEALLATLAHFLGEDWTPELAGDWTAAYGIVSEVMVQSAARSAKESPPFWEGEIVAHERRCVDLAVITIRPESAIPYLPGQSLSIQVPQRPRMWRFYSPANAPRADGSVELHVRAIDGGWVSSALVMSAAVGDVVRLGPAIGDLTLHDDRDGDVLLIAGGTGLAPLRAIVDQLGRRPGRPRRVHLFHEARTEADLYDLPALDRFASTHPWMDVVPVARQGPVARALPGAAVDVAVRHGHWHQHEVYVCGSPTMASNAVATLLEAGILPARIHQETLGYRIGPQPEAGPDVEFPDVEFPPAPPVPDDLGGTSAAPAQARYPGSDLS